MFFGRRKTTAGVGMAPDAVPHVQSTEASAEPVAPAQPGQHDAFAWGAAAAPEVAAVVPQQDVAIQPSDASARRPAPGPAGGPASREVASFQAAALLGETVAVLMRSPRHRGLTLADPEARVAPAVARGQVAIARAQIMGRPRGGAGCRCGLGRGECGCRCPSRR